MNIYRTPMVALLAVVILATSAHAATTYVSVKTDVPYYDVAIRLINYASEDVMGSAYMKTDAYGNAEGNFTISEDQVKITIIVYRDGVVFKKYENYGVYPTGGTISIDLREKKDEPPTNDTNLTAPSTSTDTTSTTTSTSTTEPSTTGNAISESAVSSQSSGALNNLWIYIAAGIIVVGAAGFLGVRYMQQKGVMTGMAKYDKAKGPIEDKPLFQQEEFQPVSEKMDNVATQQELKKARDRIKSLEKELTMARNADKIRETEKKIEEDKKRLERLRRGENA